MKNVINILFTLLVGIAVGIAAYGSYTSHDYSMSTQPPEPQIEYVYIETEKVVEVPVKVEVPVYVEEEFFRNISDADSWYYKDYAMREGESEGVTGMLWLMYTFENRCEAYGHTPEEEWASPASESSMFRTGIEPNEDCLKAYELFIEGWEPKPLYFRAGHYHSFGTELCQVGNHYFSR